MKKLANTTENKTMISALKKISETKWVGNTTFANIEFCLASINISTGKNSGWYSPSAVRIPGLTGIYMVHQDGSLCYDFRVIKESETCFRIETLSNSGFNEFEQLYSNLLP